jgi:tetratricopeptide (TPR) repeat protein
VKRFHTLALSGMALAALAVATAWAQLAEPQPAPAPTDDYYDIGDFHYATSTRSPAAQLWFDRGLAMCFGFNHEEAVRCFERALAEDPTLAMALWGVAYALGPNINNMLIAPEPMAQAALSIRLAEVLSPHASPLERELIAALAKRYAMPVPALDAREPLNQAYADELRAVHKRHPDDPLATALFAEALMNLQPWKNWLPDGASAKHTPELIAVLEDGLARWPDHPFLCHLYIHAIEASPTPEQALPIANRLRTLAPGLGHLVHMPSHIDVLMGDYDEVIATNNAAIGVDREFVRQQGAMNFFTLYRVHNYHFLTYGAMFDGQSGLALRAAREMVNQIPEPMLRAQTDFLDAFVPTPLHVLIRFGRWDEILAEPEPADYLPMTRSIRHYARGLAYAATGRVAEAEAEQRLFNEVRKTVPETSFLFQNPSTSILGVAEAMLAGEIAYRKGDFAAAFDHLREAVRRDDALNYDEPWGWMQPARHALGALLLEQNQPVEAEAAFRADLKRHPHNPWALHGLAECLAKQNRPDEAARFEVEYQAAIDDADVSIDRSCFCRLSAED